MLPEITATTEGIRWMNDEDEEPMVMIHGKKVGLVLFGEVAEIWKREGCRRLIGNRVVKVEIKKKTFVACYQPVWGHWPEEMQEYRNQLEEIVHRSKREDMLIIGGDFNSNVGKRNNRSRDLPSCGIYGLGKMNDAGEDLIEWTYQNSLCYINSFFEHRHRGTWFNNSLRR